MRLLSEKGWYVQPVKKYRKQNPRKDGLLPQQHIDVERRIGNCHEMYFEYPWFNKERNYEIRITDKRVLIKDNHRKYQKYKYYKVININQRFFIKQITLNEFLDTRITPFDLQISTDEIHEKDINFYINLLYPQEYQHQECYLPSEPQNIDDVWWIDEKEILGDISSDSQEESEDDLGYEFENHLNTYDQIVVYHFPKYNMPYGTIWRRV